MLIVEVMGRYSGWIALHSGMAAGANVILIPERPFQLKKCAGSSSAASPATMPPSSW